MKETIDIEILRLLHDATIRGQMEWRIVEDSEDDLFESQIGDDSFEIALIYFARSEEKACEQAAARIQGKKIYQTYSIGTKGYDLLMSILRENMFGWKDASKSSQKDLRNLKDRLEKEISQNQRVEPTVKTSGDPVNEQGTDTAHP